MNTTGHNFTQYIDGKIGRFQKPARLAQTCFLLFALALAGAQAVAQNASGGNTRKIVREGVEVEFSIQPITDKKGDARQLMEGQDARVQFKIIDTATGTPITNLRPSAWIDLRSQAKPTEIKECREKIQSFMQGSLSARPEIDLNSYYLLVMNREASISVIDPLISFGSSKLLTLILLSGTAEDWVMSRDGKRLFVTMPLINKVAVIDTITFKVVSNIDVGSRPARIAFQPDEKYLWVANDAEAGSAQASGVTVIDTLTLKVAAQIATGAGRHEIAFTTDDRFAFVTNKQEGTLSVIDVQRLAKVKDISVGQLPASIAFSPLSKAVYVASEAEGTITVVDGNTHQIITRIKAKPGLRVVRFAPEARWGFAANTKESIIYVFDASTNSIIHTITVGRAPDQISFTEAFAYIRSLGTEMVSMIPLVSLGKEAKITQFAGGQYAPEASGTTSMASAITPAPEGNTVMVANPADKIIYYYAEGMTAPMGNFQNYKREPKAVLIVDRSMRETSPGIYTNIIKVPAAGNHDVAFLTDSPRIAHCFDLTVSTNPALKKEYEVPVLIESLIKETTVQVEKEVRLRFKLLDVHTRQPKTGLKDVGVLAFLAPGIWQKREWAKEDGEGIYEVSIVPPKEGVYYVFIECPSLKVRLNQLPYVILQAKDKP